MAWSARLLLITALVSSWRLASSACGKPRRTSHGGSAAGDGRHHARARVTYSRCASTVRPAMTGSHQVAPDGTINFPLLGAVEVSGLEPTQVAQKIQSELRDRDLLRDPHVSVYVEAYSSKRVSVVGAVANPGTFALEPGHDSRASDQHGRAASRRWPIATRRSSRVACSRRDHPLSGSGGTRHQGPGRGHRSRRGRHHLRPRAPLLVCTLVRGSSSAGRF